MTEHHQDASFLATIRANPADDLPRSVWCDHLEETAGSVRCERCGGDGKVINDGVEECSDCDGSGRASDGRRERAEFIRSQLLTTPVGQLRTMFNHERERARSILGDDWENRYEVMCRRERELFAAHCDRWFPVPDGFGYDWGQFLTGNEPAAVGRAFWVIRRGFVDEVRCHAGVWLGRGRELICRHPIGKVTLHEQEPDHLENAEWVWTSDINRRPPTPYQLPDPIWRALRDGTFYEHDDPDSDDPDSPAVINFHSFSSLGAAHKALSDACLRWARG